MKVTTTALEGVIIIEPDLYRDSRGFFLESFNIEKYAKLGIVNSFVQDNHSRSIQNTLRGLHAQLSRPQGKLVRVLQGSIYDVVVDVRIGSPTYKKWIGVDLSSENFRQCYVPIGFMHGFCVTSEVAEVEYKVTDFYDPSGELCLSWNDPTIGVRWPTESPILSHKDASGMNFSQIENVLHSRGGKAFRAVVAPAGQT